MSPRSFKLEDIIIIYDLFKTISLITSFFYFDFMHLILSYFDHIEGPKIFQELPAELSESIKSIILGLLDIKHDEHFFEYHLTKEKKQVLYNYYLKIETEYARGGIDYALITVFSDVNTELSFINYILKRIADEFINDPELSLIFHRNQMDETEFNAQLRKINRIMKQNYEILFNKVKQVEIVDRLFENEDIQHEKPSSQIVKTMVRTFITYIDAKVPEGAVLLRDIGKILANKFEPYFISTDSEVLIEEVRRFWKKNAFGEVDNIQYEPNQIQFNVYDCFECSHFPNINNTVCKFDEGFLGGLLKLKLNKKFIVKEIECYASGYNHCKFVVKSV